MQNNSKNEISVADPEGGPGGGGGGLLEPPLRQNHSIFMENFKKNQEK